MIQIELYKLKSATVTDVVYGSLTIPETGVTVYANISVLTTNRNEIFNGLLNNEVIGINVDGVTELTKDKSLQDLAYVCDVAETINLTQYINQVRWNISLSDQLVSLVRGEMLGESLSQMGVTPTEMLSKLSGVIGAIQVGMFKEAWQMLQYQVVQDAFLTPERIARYVDILQSCDVIQY